MLSYVTVMLCWERYIRYRNCYVTGYTNIILKYAFGLRNYFFQDLSCFGIFLVTLYLTVQENATFPINSGSTNRQVKAISGPFLHACNAL